MCHYVSSPVLCGTWACLGAKLLTSIEVWQKSYLKLFTGEPTRIVETETLLSSIAPQAASYEIALKARLSHSELCV